MKATVSVSKSSGMCIIRVALLRLHLVQYLHTSRCLTPTCITVRGCIKGTDKRVNFIHARLEVRRSLLKSQNGSTKNIYRK